MRKAAPFGWYNAVVRSVALGGIIVMGSYAAFAQSSSSSESGTIVGRTVHAKTGLAVPGVAVRLTGRTSRVTQSTEDGWFVFPSVPAGRYSLSPSKSGWLNARGGDSEIEIGTSVPVLETRIGLLKAGAIAGTITDEKGHPLTSAAVYALRIVAAVGNRRTLQAASTVRTDDRGFFRLGRLPSGRYLVAVAPRVQTTAVGAERLSAKFVYPVTFSPGVRRSTEAEIVEVRPQGESLVTMGVAPVRAWDISGVVQDGTAALSAMLVLRPVDSNDDLPALLDTRQTLANALDGRFVFHDVPPNDYVIELSTTARQRVPANTVKSWRETRLVVASDGHFSPTGEVGSVVVDAPRVARAGVEHVRGIVTTVTGSPLNRALVSLQGDQGLYTIESDSDGFFRFVGVAEGTYTLSAVRAGYVLAPNKERLVRITVSQRAVQEQASSVTLQMQTGGVVAGQVLDQVGEPAFATVRLWRVERQNGVQVLQHPGRIGEVDWQMTTDDEGSYRFFGLPAGDYVISAEPMPGAAVPTTNPAEVAQALAALKRPRGLPSQRAASQPFRATVVSSASIVVDSSRQRLRTYYPGTLDISAARFLTVSPGRENNGVSIQLQPANSLNARGVVVAPGGRDEPFSIMVTRKGWAGALLGAPLVHREPDGRFLVTGLAPGSYTVVARSISSALSVTAEANVTVDAYDIEGLRLEMRPTRSPSR